MKPLNILKIVLTFKVIFYITLYIMKPVKLRNLFFDLSDDLINYIFSLVPRLRKRKYINYKE